MTDVHCEKFPNCMVVGINATIPVCEVTDCPGRARANFAQSFAAAIAAKPEPATADDEVMAEMRAQLWAAGLDLEESAFVARMLFRNGQRIVAAGMGELGGHAPGLRSNQEQ